MKINIQIKFFLSFVCIGMWLLGGSSTALGDSAATLGDLVKQSGASSRPGFVPPSGSETAQQQKGASEIQAAGQPGTDGNESVERYVTIDFEDVDINLFVKYISELTGKNFIVDKAIRGNVTIVSPTKISIDEAYQVFESVLEVQGFTTVPAGSIIKIVPSADARSKSVETGFKGDTGEVSDKIVTQLIPLKYADPDELKKLFTPLVSKNSVVIAYPATNLLIVTDVLSNINRLMQIIKEIDVEENVSEITVIPLENAIATEVATILDTIFEGTTTRRTTTSRTARRRTPAAAAPTETGPALGEVKIIADERTNSLIIIASLYDTQKVKSLVAILDMVVPRGSGNINVYYLQHANAEELSKVLTALPDTADQAAEKGKAPTISKEVQIVADKATNSLVITANKADYAILEEVIKKLDIPRRMVYLEALIMEVDAEKDFDVGVEWVGAAKYNILGDDQGLIFGGYRPGDSSSIPSPTNPVLPRGFSMGVFSEPIEINGQLFPSLGAILSAYKKDSDVHIISTPQILTTDNEEAEINVGQNVPYITSQNTTSANQDYTNYEYKDVGTVLKITPQINQENVLRLEIYVEVIRLKSDVLTNTPTTFQRKVQTTVIIEDSATLVLGGIIGDDVQNVTNKIPLLGDIPFLGWLFKAESQSVDRVNLYIFLTPRIIRNPSEALAVTKEKREDAEYHHESGWAAGTFKYKENEKESLKSQHAPATIKTEEHSHKRPKIIEELKD